MGIFISYTTRDYYINRELLIRVSKEVSEYGSFYIDLLHNNSINKQQHVELMLSQATLVVLLNSESINQSEWVQWELHEAVSKGIPIINITTTPDQDKTINNLRSKLASEAEKLTKT